MSLLVLVCLLLLYPYHSTSVANLKYFETLSHVTVTSSIKRSADGTRDLFKRVMFRAFDRHFDLTVQPGTHLMAGGFHARLVDGDGSSSLFHVDHNQMFSGHLSDSPDVRVHAHIEETLWSVQIFDHDNIYMLEPAWRLLTPAENPRNDTLIAYRASDLTSDSFNSSQFCDVKKHKESERSQRPIAGQGFFRDDKNVNSSFGYKKGAKTTRDKRSRIDVVCTLYLVADYTFYQGKCNGNHVACAALMFALVNLVDHIYTTSTFEDPNFQQYIGVGVQVGGIAIYKTYTTAQSTFQQAHFNAQDQWTANRKLESFGFYISYLALDVDYCAHHLFTDYPFPNRILGITWLKTLCYSSFEDRPGFVRLNSAISSGTDVIAGALPNLQMNLVFAHGHIFGSEHDPATKECSNIEQYGDNFLMWSKAVTGKYPNNLKFSPCSLRHIGLQLTEDRICLVPRPVVSHFCGNGAVEDNEVCDAGSSGLMDADLCCNSSCRLRKNATCSDTNHLCCQNCDMAPANTPCLSGVPAECSQPSYCTGRDHLCPNPDMAADGTPCPGFGHCYSGKCLSFCSTLSRSLGVQLQGCLCRTNDDGAACRWCCFKVGDINDSDSCQVYSDKPLSDGMPCYMGFCQNGVCESYDVTTIQRIYRFLPSIKKSELVKFIKNHLVLCLIVISLIIWLPPAVIIYRTDARDKERLKPETAMVIGQLWQLSDEPVVESRVSSAHNGSLLWKHESPNISVITDDMQIRREVSTSMISFGFSEASRIFTGGGANIHVTAIPEEVDNTAGDTVDGNPHSAVGEAHSDVGIGQSDVVDKTQSHVVDKTQSHVVDKTQRDVVDKTQSHVMDKTQRDVVNKTQSHVVDKTQRDVVNKTQRDVVDKTQRDVVNKTQRDVVNKTQRDVVNKTQRDVVNKTQREAANASTQ